MDFPLNQTWPASIYDYPPVSEICILHVHWYFQKINPVHYYFKPQQTDLSGHKTSMNTYFGNNAMSYKVMHRGRQNE